MTSTRPYRKGLDYQIAYEELVEFSGTQFDPAVVIAFIEVLENREALSTNPLEEITEGLAS